jgi:transposase
MIEADKRMAIYLLHQEGVSLKEIVRQFRVSRNTVRAVIKQQGKMPLSTRRDKVRIDADLLGRLYQACDGWIQRVYEKLTEEEGIQVKYSTLTRLLRGLGIGKPQEKRCDRVPDVPGAEFHYVLSLIML